MRIVRFLISALGVLLLAACGSPTAAVQVTEPWVRAAVVTGAAMPAADASAHGQSDPMPTTEGAMHGGHSEAAAMAMGSTSAAYMVLRSSGAADSLLAVTTDVAEVVELHTVERDGAIMRMRPVPQIDVPAGGSTTLEPGGLHVMLIGLRRDLQAGETIRLTLNFANAGEVIVEAPVRAP
jgi:periplasmic copper chaperone A